MSAITTAAAGNWSATGTWTGGVIPGNGDTVTLNHAVTCDDNRIVGTSPAAGGVVITALADLTIATGATLTCRGGVTLNNCKLIRNAGATFEFDASQAGTPSTARYTCQIGTANNQANARFVSNGTQFQRCTFRSVSTNGGANGRCTDGGFLAAGSIDCTYDDWLRIGDASNVATAISYSSTGGMFRMIKCTVDGCGILGSVDGVRAETINYLYGVTTKNSQGADSVRFQGSTAIDPNVGGVRWFENCVFDANVNLNMANLTVLGTFFRNGFSGGSNTNYDRWEGNLHAVESASTPCYDGVTNDYFIKHGVVNPHYLEPDAGGILPKPSVDGCIFEQDGTDSQGDCILMPNPAAARSYYILRCIVLPNNSGLHSGTMVTALGNANCTFSVQHCTYCSSDNGVGVPSGTDVGETYNAHAGMVAYIKDNIAFKTSGTGGYKIQNINGAPITDVVLAANADFNTGWNLSTGSKGKGYNTPMTGTPGASDVEGDPLFVDSARDMKAWDLMNGGPGTTANAEAELAKINDASGWNSQYTIYKLWTWVREGFRPTKAALKTGASDGTYIGAVPFYPDVPTRVAVFGG